MKRLHPIEELIAQGEHQRLDFKFEVSDSKKIARTLSAFANTDGGRLLIGVKDNGAIAGVRSDEEYYMIEAASTMYTRPSVSFSAKRWDMRGKTVLEIYVAPGPDKPYLAPDKDGRYKAYLRVADENILASEIVALAWRKKQRREGVYLEVNDAIEALFGWLERHDAITANQFRSLARIPYRMARDILSDLLAMDTLDFAWAGDHFIYRGKGLSLADYVSLTT